MFRKSLIYQWWLAKCTKIDFCLSHGLHVTSIEANHFLRPEQVGLASLLEQTLKLMRKKNSSNEKFQAICSIWGSVTDPFSLSLLMLLFPFT